jgi:hypothetical protein
MAWDDPKTKAGEECATCVFWRGLQNEYGDRICDKDFGWQSPNNRLFPVCRERVAHGSLRGKLENLDLAFRRLRRTVEAVSGDFA